MSSLLITNGHLVTLDEDDRFIEGGSIYIEGNRIVEVGEIAPDTYSPDRTIDARGSLVMPGLINTHHHLYSTFARGFAPPGPPAQNFAENLKNLWWKLDLGPELRGRVLLCFAGDHACRPCRVHDHHRSPRITVLLGRQSRSDR